MSRITLSAAALSLALLATVVLAAGASSKPATSAPASKPASQPSSQSAGKWSGPVEKTMSGVPRLVMGETHYRLKAAPSAAKSVEQTLSKIGGGELTGTYEVTGTLDNSQAPKVWIVVDSIKKVQ